MLVLLCTCNTLDAPRTILRIIMSFSFLFNSFMCVGRLSKEVFIYCQNNDAANYFFFFFQCLLQWSWYCGVVTFFDGPLSFPVCSCCRPVSNTDLFRIVCLLLGSIMDFKMMKAENVIVPNLFCFPCSFSQLILVP